MKPGRNDPCHCGSDKKYKKCHLAQDEAAARAAPRPPMTGARLTGAQVARQMADTFLTSDDVDDEALAIAEHHFAEKDAGRGPAQQMMDFAQPLVEANDGSTDGLNKALTMGMFFWNLAISPTEDREKAMAEMLASFDKAEMEVRTAFQEMANVMVERHEAMFPELHARK
jgi:SEC-C motif